ncbi:YceH family protein [Solilutibacter silvestris]|uniref:YceH family protein n=1 Tax=Solilutibacter silvestris TaxID=1645665 RepID=UPI003D3585E9
METRENAPLPLLNMVEARVLGCLIEKAVTTPDVYPLTINATQQAANQKTGRDPVMSLSPGDTNHALRQLEQKGLVRQSFSSRADRYEHRVETAFSLTPPQSILLGLLLLRGKQTAYELLARSERMAKFAEVEDVRHQLDRLVQRQPALVVRLPCGPGQREDRYTHLLGGPVTEDSVVVTDSREPPVAAVAPSPDLGARVLALEAEVAALREAVAQLLPVPEAS